MRLQYVWTVNLQSPTYSALQFLSLPFPWLLGRLIPDYKSIAEFRRMHREAIAEAGAELVRFARSVGLVHGEW